MTIKTVEQHYNQHLGPVYSWITGGVDSALQRGAAEVATFAANIGEGDYVVDLGAGFGMHAIALAQRGAEVVAIDNCEVLLNEMNENRGDLPIETVHGDLAHFVDHLRKPVDLALCMTDTLNHLASILDANELVRQVYKSLAPGGRFVLSIRDYSGPPTGTRQFIPVRSTRDRVFVCMLEYFDDYITVHDLLHSWDGDQWDFRVSAYRKLRIDPVWLVDTLTQSGFDTVQRSQLPSGMVRLVAERG